MVFLMANYTTSSNMFLQIPTAGVSPGPEFALLMNSDMTLLDQHDHTPGKGVQITPAGLNINTALNFADNFLTSVAGVTFSTQANTPAIGTIYEAGVDLYFVDGLGNNIQITQNGGIAGSPGSISNLTPPASASYISASSKFKWESNTNIAADMDFGSAIMRNLSPNSTFALTLQPPAGLSSNFTETLPVIPATTSFMTMNTAGEMLTSQVYPLTAAGIETSAVTTVKIQDASVTRPKLAPLSLGASSTTASYVDTRNTSAFQSIPGSQITNFTSTGRPLMFVLQGAPPTDSYIEIYGGDNTGGVTAQLRLVNTATAGVLYQCTYSIDVRTAISSQGTGSISSQGINTGNSAANSGITAGANSGITTVIGANTKGDPGTVCFIFVASAGTYSFELQNNLVGPSGRFKVNNMQLYVYEMA